MSTTPTCVIVGAGTGVSMGVARRFAREGFRLGLMRRRVDQLQISGLGDVQVFSGDAGDPDSIKRAFEHVFARLGRVDVLVYNAAAGRQTLPSLLEPEALLADFRVNVMGALACAQQVIPHMRTMQGGTILLTGGGLALNPRAQFASLALGKAGLRSLAFSLAEELEADGIHVATVTIAGFVQAGTHFDPDLIAEHYWQLHTQKRGSWEREIVYR
ncbi:MAG: SDR family NAD(P)-dependent oxidoreductase [Chloroflexi bacterium]|nr:SDR family NAD(P)-dependent oxidoreductase [Chloroflexota bacterium]